MAGNVVSNVKKYYGGQVPVPSQGDSDGKVKVLVEKTATMEIEGVQTEVELLYDADDLTTPVTPQQLGQWTDENYLIAFKTKNAEGTVRGFILYALETDSTSTDTLVNRAEFVNFKGEMTDPGASAYIFEMVEDSSTLTRYLRDENGELIVKFNQSCVEAGAQSGTLDHLVETDSSYMKFEVVYEGGNAYLNLNTTALADALEYIQDDINYILNAIDELPSDEHGYFNSTLIQTPGDGTTTNLVMDNFRIAENRDVHGESIEFVPTHQEGGIDFGEVYLNPGTYIFTVHYTLQWVGNPRGTFLPLVTNVGDRPFDFSYEHEDVVRTTRIVTRTTRGKFSLGFPFDADTPPMGIWVKNLEIAQIASYNHPAVAHDTTLTGKGQLGDPLGVTPAAFGKVKDIPTSISQFRTGDVIPVDGPNGPAKMGKADLLTETAQNALAGNVAPEFVPNETNAVAGKLYLHDGVLVLCLVNYNGDWDSTKFIAFPLADYVYNLSKAVAPIFDPERTSENPYKKGEVVIYKGWAFRFTTDFYGPWTGNNVVYVSMESQKFTKANLIEASASKQNLASLLLSSSVGGEEKKLALDLLTCNQVRKTFDIEHKVYNSNGVGTDNTNYDAVYKTPVNPGDIVIITSQIYTEFYSVMAYDKDGEIIDRQFTDGFVTDQVYIVPSNAVALTCQGRNSNYAPGVVFKLAIVADTTWFASSILNNAETIKELQVKHDEDIDSLYHSIVEEPTGLTIDSDTRGLAFEPGKYGDDIGRLQSSSVYNSWLYDVQNDTELYCEVPTSPYFSVVVTNTAMTSGVRYRRMQGEDTLPTSENPITITAGKRLIITERADSHVDWDVILPQESYIKSFNPNIPLAEEQVQQVVDAMEKKDVTKISVKYTSGSGLDSSTERIDIYVPCKVGYCNYQFLHSVYADINCDAWRIGYAIAVSDSLVSRYYLTSKGEWECAVHLDGRDDFSGGVLHGDEVLVGDPIIFVDGESVSLSDISSLTECEELRVVTKSTLYDPADRTTAIAEHGCEHTFTKDGVRIRQSLKWLVNETITSCYMAMNLPTQEVSTKYYTDKDVAPVSTPSPLNLSIDDAKSLVMFDETLGILNEFYLGRNYPMLEGVNGYLLLTDNNSITYNKGYFVINRTARSITSGTIWKTEHFVNFEIGK